MEVEIYENSKGRPSIMVRSGKWDSPKKVAETYLGIKMLLRKGKQTIKKDVKDANIQTKRS